MAKIPEPVKRNQENAVVGGIVYLVLTALIGGGSYPLIDDYIDNRVAAKIQTHSEAGHLSPELIAYQALEAEDGLAKRIDHLTKIECETGADLHEEIRDKRKLYRKITGETYKQKSCDEV